MCTWPRIWLLTQAFTIVAAVTLAMALCASGATARTVAVAAATFCVVRLAWYCWLNRSSGMSAERVPGMGSPGRGNKILTDEQVEFFDRAGYLILPQVVAAEEATKLAVTLAYIGAELREESKRWNRVGNHVDYTSAKELSEKAVIESNKYQRIAEELGGDVSQILVLSINEALAEKDTRKAKELLEKIDESEYGKFAWVIDPEGNKVELWQPPQGQ